LPGSWGNQPYREGTKWQRRLACLVFIGYFPHKSPIVGRYPAERDQQLEASYASSPPCSRFLNPRTQTAHDNHMRWKKGKYVTEFLGGKKFIENEWGHVD